MPLRISLDHTLAALADPTRRAILERLAGRECRVTELAQPFAMSLSAVSKHIRALERARLVRRRRQGREHWLSLVPGALDEAAHWITTQQSAWAARLQALDEMLQAQERQSTASSANPRNPHGR